jgi:membrane protease YdiL (CAAX protease family)
MEKSGSEKILWEWLIILILTIVSALLGYYGSIVALFLIFVIYFLRRYLEGISEIYSDKKLMPVFCIIYSILFINTLLISLGLYDLLGISEGSIKTVIKIICVLFSFILLKSFNISIRNFKWNVSRSQIISTLIIALVFTCVIIYFDGLRFIYMFNGDILQYSLYILKTIILVAFFEEFLCRGILISGLKTYTLSEWKINIIQASLFGILHYARYIDRGVVNALLITSYQIVIGCFFGRLYLKTKTLTPGIFIHLLWDIL